MRFFYLAFLAALSSCINHANQEQAPQIFTEIDSSGYKRYRPVDTLYKTNEYIATSCEDTTGIYKGSQIVLRMTTGRYFLLDPFTYLENDSTLIYYSPPFKTDSENGSFQKDGIWFYAHFYKDQADTTAKRFFPETGSGVYFGVDSLPKNGEQIVRPKSEGIYFYENNSLHKIASLQTDEVFYDFGKNGFYFLPNTGRFFKRYSTSILK